MERDARLKELRAREEARQTKWRAERQAELDRERVVSELGNGTNGNSSRQFDNGGWVRMRKRA